MPSVSENSAPLVTAAVLFETSLGAFVADLFGVDCPVATAELVNLCRCKFFNGCIASEVIPENVMIFAHPIAGLRGRTFASLAGLPDTFTAAMRSELQRMRTHTACLRSGSGSGPLRWSVDYLPLRPDASLSGRPGLLLLEPGSGRLLVTLTARRLGALAERCLLVGAVREGDAVVRRMRAAPHQRPRPPGAFPASSADANTATSSSSSFSSSSLSDPAAVRPTRVIRLKHATLLPTAGAPLGPQAKGSAAEPLAEALRATECFRHWATDRQIRAANATVARCVREESGGEGFVMLPSSAQRAAEDDIVSVEYNPHYHGEYLSSDDGEDNGNGSGGGGSELRREREKRRQAVLRAHQERLNETRALMLNLLDGIADTTGELRPPENVLFVCKLNPITTGEGLAMCFSQFGRVVSSEVIADRRTGNSLCYAFIEFEDVDACFRAFQKMDNALIDDHRIHVDFSQSVSKLWAQRQCEARKRRRPEEA